MGELLAKRDKKEVVKDIILRLHRGLSLEEAKRTFEEEVGSISSTEIAEIEQSLMNEGLSPEEIKKFCNVHALLFQSALEKSISKEEAPIHPVTLFKLENREIEKRTNSLRELADNLDKYGAAEVKDRISRLLEELRGIDIHYTRKEQLLFPSLERHGFYGPSKVMWGKDDEIRDLLKKAISEIDKIEGSSGLEAYIRDVLNPLIEEVEGMIFKEENILFPTSIEKLDVDEWVEILRESDEIGYAFIEKPRETAALIEELKKAVIEEPIIKDNSIIFPTGELRANELMAILNTLPVDITFVDGDDRVRYFSDNGDRIFVRTKSVLGRKVQNCHPPQSLDRVEEILRSFKEGRRRSAEFWINYKGRFVYIRYIPVRDVHGRYLGTVEVTQDITNIKGLEGERRLLDEEDRSK
jgi:PAS domain S-box-containing protein